MTFPTTSNPVRLVSLLPHAIDVQGTAERFTLHPSGTVARLTETELDRHTVDADGLQAEVATIRMDQAAELPSPVEGTLYVVSRVVALLNSDRPDLLAPGKPIRDESGKTLAVQGLVRIEAPQGSERD